MWRNQASFTSTFFCAALLTRPRWLSECSAPVFSSVCWTIVFFFYRCSHFYSRANMLFFFLQLTVQKSPSNLTLLWKRNASFFFFSFSTPCLFLLSPYSFYRLYCAPKTLFFFFTLINTSVELRTEEGSVFFFTAATVYTHTHTTEKKKKNKKADGVYFFHRCHWSSRVIVAAGSFFFFFLAFVNDRIGCCFLTFTFFFLCWCKQGEEWSWHPRCV